MKPVIAIVAAIDEKENNIYLRRSYALAVEKAGGLPFLLPPLLKTNTIPAILGRIDALILAGGGDIDPAYFGEEPSAALGKVEPERDFFELALVKAAWERDLPVLGICRGLQVMNIALGGDIWQDIEEKGQPFLQHQQKAPFWHPVHQVELAPFLWSEFGKILSVNSFHHQAVRRFAPGLSIAARSADGLIEALVDLEKTFFWGVQWHPEYLINSPVGDGLFHSLLGVLEG